MKLTSLITILGLALAGILTSARAGTPDPSVNFGFGVTNTSTSVVTFTYDFPMPSGELSVNLPAGTYDVSATFGITLTAGGSDTAVFSLPGGTPSYMQSFINGQNAGVNVGTATESVTGGTEVFNFAPVTSQYDLLTTGTTLGVVTTFELSPGDSASFSGSFVVQAVPEPASFGLGLVAFGAFAGLVVYSRRKRA